jgi:hypothetical protein
MELNRMACNIDHSVEDVITKLESQNEFLPENLYSQLTDFLKNPLSQEILNETFHLLKKYDLSDVAEQRRRITAFQALIKNN